MESIRSKTIPVFLRFIDDRTISEDVAVALHNDLLNVYFIRHTHEDYEFIRDCAKACMKLGHLMTHEDNWFRSRSILYWTLYILKREVISIELADDMILTAFRKMLATHNSMET